MHTLAMGLAYLLCTMMVLLMTLKYLGVLYYMFCALCTIFNKDRLIVLVGCPVLKMMNSSYTLSLHEEHLRRKTKKEVKEAIIQLVVLSLFLFVSYKVVIEIISIGK